MPINGEVATTQIVGEEDQDVGTCVGRKEVEGKGKEEEAKRIHRLCEVGCLPSVPGTPRTHTVGSLLVIIPGTRESGLTSKLSSSL